MPLIRPLRLTALAAAMPNRLPLTALSLTLLLALPTALLLAVPRRTATGLERLLPIAALLQSFPAQPAQRAPLLWQQRLGPAPAQQLWSQQRRFWWQLWGPHGDAGAYLVFAAPAALPLPSNGLRVDDLVVVAPDPLARQLLQEQLKARRRPPRGLALRCSQSLRQQQAVHWSAGALGQMLGPIAPLAQELQQGCLLLSSSGRTLFWQGEADLSEGSLAAAPPQLPIPAPSPLPPAQWLELRGASLDLLLHGLLGSSVLRDALAKTYGLGPETLRRFRPMPFQLRLQPISRGPFVARLELQLEVGQQRQLSQRWLSDLSEALRDQGLTPAQPMPGITAWQNERGLLVGGWRWRPGSDQLLLFLGPVPTAVAVSPPLGEASWRLRLRPEALAQAKLLPSNLPPLLQRAQQLQMVGRPVGSRSGERRNSLAGRLELP